MTWQALLLFLLPACLYLNQGASNSFFTAQAEPDRLTKPPEKNEQLSRNKQYLLVVQSDRNWKTPHPGAFLYKLDYSDKIQYKSLLWHGRLPQYYGPRYMLISPFGQALLLDDWVNVKSHYAIYLIHGNPRRITSYTLDDIIDVLDMPPASIGAFAKGGSWWISAPPELTSNGNKVYIPTAGKILITDLESGRLTLK